MPLVLWLYIKGGIGEDFLPTTISVVCPDNGASSTTPLDSVTFFLSQKSLVTFTYTMSVTISTNTAGATIRDNMPRAMENFLRFSSVPVAFAGPPAVNNTFARSSVIYTNGSANNVVQGVFTNRGSSILTLPAGTYKIQLCGRTLTGTGSNSGYTAIFGQNTSDNFDIISIPIN